MITGRVLIQGMQSRDSCVQQEQAPVLRYRNHKSAGEKLGLFRVCKFFYVFCQQIPYRLFRNHFLNEHQRDLSVAGKQWLI